MLAKKCREIDNVDEGVRECVREEIYKKTEGINVNEKVEQRLEKYEENGGKNQKNERNVELLTNV
jgi:hypothetical protein